MSPLLLKEKGESKDPENSRIINAFSEALKIAKSNPCACDNFVTKYNEWRQKIEPSVIFLSQSLQNVSDQDSLSVLQRCSVTAFFVVWILESMRSRNVDCFMTGLFFCILLVLLSFITSVVGFLSKKSNESATSFLNWVSAINSLLKEINLRLRRVRNAFQIPADNDLLCMFPGDASYPVLSDLDYFSRLFSVNFMFWFQMSPVALIIQVDAILIFLYFFELGKCLGSFALVIIIFNALIQFPKFRKIQKEIQHHLNCVDFETEKFLVWFLNKSVLGQILKDYEFLKDPVLNILKCGNAIRMITPSQSYILLAMTVIKASDGLHDRIYSRCLQNIIQFLLFKDESACLKSRVEFISNETPHILRKESTENQNSLDRDQFEIDKPFKRSSSEKYAIVNTAKQETKSQGYSLEDLDKWCTEQLTKEKEQNWDQPEIDIIFERSSSQQVGIVNTAEQGTKSQGYSLEDLEKWCTKQLTKEKEQFSTINLNFPISGSTMEWSFNDSAEESRSNYSFERRSFGRQTTVSKASQEAYNSEFRRNCLFKSSEERNSNRMETDAETEYKFIIDLLFIFFCELINIFSLDSAEILEDDSENKNSSNKHFARSPSKKFDIVKEDDQDSKYNFIIDFLFIFISELTNIFSSGSVEHLEDDSKTENLSKGNSESNPSMKFATIKENDQDSKYDFVIDLLFILFSKLAKIFSLASAKLFGDNFETENSSNCSFGGNYSMQFVNINETDQGTEYNFIIELLLDIFSVLHNIFLLDSEKLLGDDYETVESSSFHFGGSPSTRFVTTNETDKKTEYNFIIEFLFDLFSVLTNIFSLDSVERLEDSEKETNHYLKRSHLLKPVAVNEVDSEIKYDFVIRVLFKLYFALVNAFSLKSEKQLVSESVKDKHSNEIFERNPSEMYAAAKEADHITKHKIFLDILLKVFAILRKMLALISEKHAAVNKAAHKSDCKQLPIKVKEKSRVEQNIQKEERIPIKSNVFVSETSKLSMNASVKQKHLQTSIERNKYANYAPLNRNNRTVLQDISVEKSRQKYAEKNSKGKEEISTMNSTVTISNRPQWVMNHSLEEKDSKKSAEKSRPQKYAASTEASLKIKLEFIINSLQQVLLTLNKVFSEMSKKVLMKDSIKEKPLLDTLRRKISEKYASINKTVCRSEYQEIKSKVKDKRHVKQNIQKKEKIPTQSHTFVSEASKLPINVSVKEKPLHSSFQRAPVQRYAPVKVGYRETASQVPSVESSFIRLQQNSNRMENNVKFKSNVFSFESSKVPMNVSVEEEPLHSSFERVPVQRYVPVKVAQHETALKLPSIESLEKRLEMLRKEDKKSKSFEFERKRKESKKKSKMQKN